MVSKGKKKETCRCNSSDTKALKFKTYLLEEVGKVERGKRRIRQQKYVMGSGRKKKAIYRRRSIGNIYKLGNLLHRKCVRKRKGVMRGVRILSLCLSRWILREKEEEEEKLVIEEMMASEEGRELSAGGSGLISE